MLTHPLSGAIKTREKYFNSSTRQLPVVALFKPLPPITNHLIPFFFSSGIRASFLDLACPPVVSMTSTHKIMSNVPVIKKKKIHTLIQTYTY